MSIRAAFTLVAALAVWAALVLHHVRDAEAVCWAVAVWAGLDALGAPRH